MCTPTVDISTYDRRMKERDQNIKSGIIPNKRGWSDSQSHECSICKNSNDKFKLSTNWLISSVAV